MRSSRSGARPQRQARSGVTYVESDDDDEEFVPSAKLAFDAVTRRASLRACAPEDAGVAKGKRTLTLKRARATLEPPVKEDMDVYAMPSPAPARALEFPHVYESAERVLSSHRRQSSAFEYLLDAVSDASGDGGSRTPLPESKLQEDMTSSAYAPELLAAYSAFERKLQAVKGAKEEGVKRVAHEEIRIVQEMKETVVTEKDMPPADEKMYIRRGEKVKSDGIPSGNAKKGSQNMEDEKQDVRSYVDEKLDVKEVKQNVESYAEHKKDVEEKKQDVKSYLDEKEEGEEDKPYDMASADEEDAEAPWNESSDASDTEEKKKKKRSVKDYSPDVKTSVKDIKVAKSDHRGRVSMPAKSTSTPPLLPKKRPALWAGTKPFVPPGPRTLQTPTAHRRVVGLSRRHRPPPLHPYLLGS